MTCRLQGIDPLNSARRQTITQDLENTLLTTKEAADYIDFEPGTLAVWRSVKRYPLRFIRIGRSIRYRKSDLDEFLKRREFMAE